MNELMPSKSVVRDGDPVDSPSRRELAAVRRRFSMKVSASAS